jgi:hypothetical protein
VVLDSNAVPAARIVNTAAIPDLPAALN